MILSRGLFAIAQGELTSVVAFSRAMSTFRIGAKEMETIRFVASRMATAADCEAMEAKTMAEFLTMLPVELRQVHGLPTDVTKWEADADDFEGISASVAEVVKAAQLAYAGQDASNGVYFA